MGAFGNRDNDKAIRKGNRGGLRARLALSTALAALFMGGYGGRSAYAACAYDGSPGTYLCSGFTNFPVSLSGAPLTVTTTNVPAPFSIINSLYGNALTLNGTGGLTFTDDLSSTIYGYSGPSPSFFDGYGIDATNNGSGALSITSTGVVTGGKGGINARNYGTDLTIEAYRVEGRTTGIKAGNFGTGALSITSSGQVTGTSDEGIHVRNRGTDVTLDTAAVNGGTDGIFAENSGTGVLTITTRGNVEGTSGHGINAYSRSSGTTVTGGISMTILSEAAVDGGTNGINATNNSFFALSITSLGQVTGTEDGIYAANGQGFAGGSDLTISSAGVTGGQNGIVARNFGAGLSITTTGPVKGTASTGIDARNGVYSQPYNTTSMTILSEAAVIGGEIGIKARNYGSGALSITSSGQVTGGSHAGIYAINTRGVDAYGQSLTVLAEAAVDSGGYGILAVNRGSGAMNVKADGPVTGSSAGIVAENSGTSLTITAASVTADGDGIRARNDGSGALSITSTETVKGDFFSGIYAFNRLGSTGLIISSESVSGGTYGIHAFNLGSGPTSITVDGAVTGGTGEGIGSVFADQTNITLNSGAVVSSDSGVAIFNDGGDSATTVNSGAGIIGEVLLNGGVDNLTFAGGDFTQVTKFDGGDGGSFLFTENDVLTFDGSSGALNGADVVNWESLIITGGSAIGFGSSTLILDLQIFPDRPGVPFPGTLLVDGGGSLVTNILAFNDFDLLDVNGSVLFGTGSELDFDLTAVTDYSLFDGLFLEFLMADNLIGFNNLAFNFSGLSALFSADVIQLGSSLFLDFSLNDVDPSVIPLPPALVLFGSGLLGLAGLRRLRRREQEPTEQSRSA